MTSSIEDWLWGDLIRRSLLGMLLQKPGYQVICDREERLLGHLLNSALIVRCCAISGRLVVRRSLTEKSCYVMSDRESCLLHSSYREAWLLCDVIKRRLVVWWPQKTSLVVSWLLTEKVSCYILCDSEDWLVADLTKRSLVVRWSLIWRTLVVMWSLTRQSLAGYLWQRRLIVRGHLVISDRGAWLFGHLN